MGARAQTIPVRYPLCLNQLASHTIREASLWPENLRRVELVNDSSLGTILVSTFLPILCGSVPWKSQEGITFMQSIEVEKISAFNQNRLYNQKYSKNSNRIRKFVTAAL